MNETVQDSTSEGEEAKIRTSVMLSPATLELLDLLKSQARRQRHMGAKATYSHILEEAITELAIKKGVKA